MPSKKPTNLFKFLCYFAKKTINGIILVLSIYFSFKTFDSYFHNKAKSCIFSFIIMFILLDLSADIQYYDGQASLQPAHTKLFFRIYTAYYILSLTLAAFTIFTSIFIYKVRQNIKSIDDSSLIINVVTSNIFF